MAPENIVFLSVSFVCCIYNLILAMQIKFSETNADWSGSGFQTTSSENSYVAHRLRSYIIKQSLKYSNL